jgi:hypothetical protein
MIVEMVHQSYRMRKQSSSWADDTPIESALDNGRNPNNITAREA